MATLFRDIFCLGVVTYAGATNWVLPVLLLHRAHFAPRHILPWCGHLCWCYWLGVSYPYCCCTMPTLLHDIFCLGVVTYAGATNWVLATHTAAAPCPLCSKSYSALVWSLMLVLLIGCYPYCCCIVPTLLQDALPVLVFCLGDVAAVARSTS